MCTNCKSKLIFIGPSDYKRDLNGNYIRLMAYQCKKCKNIITK